MSKVLLIGLDGATFDVLRPLAAAGRLPTLARLMHTGAQGTLKSAVPPITPTAWTSVFTGKNPGKHGIYDFQRIDPATYERHPVRVDQHREKTLWDLLGEAGKRSIVMDVPFTYPPRPLPGLMLTGYGTPRTPETIFTYPNDWHQVLPPHLHSEIRVGLPRHRFDRSQALIDEWRDIMNGRSALLTHLLQAEPWDFFFTVFNITDNMSHIFWTYADPAHPNFHKPAGDTYREALFNAYEQCDAIISDMLTLVDEETAVFVMSDHGFGSIYTRQYLFQRLLDGGFIRYRSGSSASWRSQLIGRLIRLYNRFPVLREWMKGLRPNQKKLLGRSLQQAGLLPGVKQIDYRRSLVLPTEFGLQLWVNTTDRFAHGVVPPAEKTAVLDKLRQHLLADRNPQTGQPIIARTHPGELLYSGTKADQGPDLVIEYTNFFQPDGHPPYRLPELEGGHTPDGIFLATGPAIKQTTIPALNLVDLAPTILHLLGEAVPVDMDGRVLTNILARPQPVQTTKKTAVWPEQPTGSAFTEAEESEINEQLRQLGYID